MSKYGNDIYFSGNDNPTKKRTAVINSLVSGSMSSAVTTILYQPLELLKTRIQLRGNQVNPEYNRQLRGRTTRFAVELVKGHGVNYLWRGTGASLLRSIPGVGFYYASLNILQTNLSVHNNRPDNPFQAFYFGLTSRSIVSFILLPVTVVKVRYESGQYTYPSLSQALKNAYSKSGWVGVVPTILRDSFFSGIYYMCYTKLKSYNFVEDTTTILLDVKQNHSSVSKPNHSLNFVFGIVSGLIASVITNPIDVLKTNIQVTTKDKSMMQVAGELLKEKNGCLRLFDGLMPRSIRRTLLAATTWTIYEFLTDSSRQRDC